MFLVLKTTGTEWPMPVFLPYKTWYLCVGFLLEVAFVKHFFQMPLTMSKFRPKVCRGLS